MNITLFYLIIPFSIIGEFPNTYSYTKSVSEEIVERRGKGLPITIVRPSIVVSTAREPIPGWVDNVNGAGGLSTGVGIGLIHVFEGNLSKVADLVPADFVVNNILAACWQSGMK